MRFSTENQDGVVILTLKINKLNSEVTAQLKAEILILAQPDIKALVFDLTSVNFIDSSGLGALLLAHRQLDEHNVPINLVGVNDMVMQMLRISRIDSLFEYYDTVEEVLTTYDNA